MMSNFRFRALTRDGEVSEGDLDAASRGEAVRRLNEKGLQVLSLSETAIGQKDKKSEATLEKESRPRPAATGEKLSSKHLIQFTEELSDLLSAGVQLDSALQSIGKRSETESIRNVAAICYEKVREGVPLASALRMASSSFNELYCNLVSAGELSGSLGDILKRQVRYLTTLADLKGKLATAMIYPAFLVVSGIGVAGMFTFFLIPKLRRLVESTGSELPPVARLMLGMGDLMKAHWALLLGLCAALLVAGYFVSRLPAVRHWWERTSLKLPILGRLLKTRFNVQFVETLSNLLSNGLPLVKALELVKGAIANGYIREQIAIISGKVSEGGTLCRSMEKSGVFDSGLVDMVRIGEDTGQLAGAMSRAGERLDREFGRSIERVGSVIQPAIILIMSLVVGVMAYMMISVIYETITVLRTR